MVKESERPTQEKPLGLREMKIKQDKAKQRPELVVRSHFSPESSFCDVHGLPHTQEKLLQFQHVPCKEEEEKILKEEQILFLFRKIIALASKQFNYREENS